MDKINIVHLCLQAPYNDYWGYQDNSLPKYHRKLGHNVTVITTNTKHDSGKIITIEEDDYVLSDGQRIIRLDYKKYKPKYVCERYKYFKIYKLLNEISPDFIMVHGLGNISVLQAIKYKREVNKDCIIIADNHLDYNIGKPKNTISNKINRISYKMLNKYTQKYYSKVYGVTPWRQTYCQDIFGISPKKTDVLVMGADDENINWNNKDEIKLKIRDKYNIKPEDFVIVTGGKIDKNKNIHLLIDAVSKINKDNIKLIVFGDIDEEVTQYLNNIFISKNIILVGWIHSNETYDYFLASDLAVFPGQHSVLWEQACACGLPSIFKYWEGMDHVDVGGNCKFLYNDSVNEIRDVILNIIENDKLYKRMRSISIDKAANEFLYSRIAEKCLNNI